MEYKYRDITMDKTKEQLIEDMRSNISTINKLSSEIKRLRVDSVNIKTEVISSNDDYEEELFIDELDGDEEDELRDEIHYYYSRIKSFKFSDGEEDIELFKRELPSVMNSNYKDIMLGLNVFFMKEINEIRTFIENERDELSIEDLNEFRDEIVGIQKKIGFINFVSNEKIVLKEENIQMPKLNNIVFLHTDSGNVYAMDDLDNNSVPRDAYEGFLELVESIENGTFKGAKYFDSNNGKLASFSEVRGVEKRVIFDRVGRNTYVIIGAFEKKSDKAKSYTGPLRNRINVYNKKRDSIIEMCKSKDYLDSQKDILEELYKFLKSGRKSKGV